MAQSLFEPLYLVPSTRKCEKTLKKCLPRSELVICLSRETNETERFASPETFHSLEQTGPQKTVHLLIYEHRHIVELRWLEH